MTDKIFQPDEELVMFAEDFSKRYTQFSVGEYESKNKKYHISYCGTLIDHETKAESDSIAGQNPETGAIEFSRAKLQGTDITPDGIFFIILWCYARGRYSSAIETDMAVMPFYMLTGKSRASVIEFMNRNVFDLNDNDENRIRKANYSKIINDDRPQTVTAAVHEIYGAVKDDGTFLEQVKTMDAEKFAIHQHHNMGQQIRNNCGLWDADSSLSKYFHSLEVTDADAMSHHILVALHKHATQNITATDGTKK